MGQGKNRGATVHHGTQQQRKMSILNIVPLNKMHTNCNTLHTLTVRLMQAYRKYFNKI